MTLEEKTSFCLKNGVHLETEVVIKEKKKKDHYKIHTYEDRKRSTYVTKGYKNNKTLGRHSPLGINPAREDKYYKLIDALFLHFYIVGYLEKGEVDKFMKLFTEPYISEDEGVITL